MEIAPLPTSSSAPERAARQAKRNLISAGRIVDNSPSDHFIGHLRNAFASKNVALEETDLLGKCISGIRQFRLDFSRLRDLVLPIGVDQFLFYRRVTEFLTNDCRNNNSAKMQGENCKFASALNLGQIKDLSGNALDVEGQKSERGVVMRRQDLQSYLIAYSFYYQAAADLVERRTNQLADLMREFSTPIANGCRTMNSRGEDVLQQLREFIESDPSLGTLRQSVSLVSNLQGKAQRAGRPGSVRKLVSELFKILDADQAHFQVLLNEMRRSSWTLTELEKRLM